MASTDSVGSCVSGLLLPKTLETFLFTFQLNHAQPRQGSAHGKHMRDLQAGEGQRAGG